MKRWGYATNSYHKTASIILEEGPWFFFVVEWIIQWICYFIPSIPFPKIKWRLRDQTDIEMNDGEKWTTLPKWFGDLNQLFHGCICMKVGDWCQKRIKWAHFDVDYDKLKKRFYRESLELFTEEN